MNIQDIKPYEKNAKKHPNAQLLAIGKSIKEFGWQQPIVVDKEGVIIVGHGRYFAYMKFKDDLGLSVPEIRVADLTEIQAKSYRIADNKLNESDWDTQLLMEELNAIEKETMELINKNLAGEVDLTPEELKILENNEYAHIIDFKDELLGTQDEKYTTKIVPPVYEPKGDKPKLSELYDAERANKLLGKIKEADIPDHEKEFLTYAAYRLIPFNYKKIANYYAHSDKELQEIMEDLALIIIDFEKAIEQGYIENSNKLLELTE